jgi:hypothetical protein
MQHAKKNELRPHLHKDWKSPPDSDASFVAAMEDVLDVYHRPYTPDYPAVCLDESSKPLVIHYTPKHGSGLNIAEIELSALKRPCLADRIPALERMVIATSAWEHDRNHRGAKVKWPFYIDDARMKLRRLYPTF